MQGGLSQVDHCSTTSAAAVLDSQPSSLSAQTTHDAVDFTITPTSTSSAPITATTCVVVTLAVCGVFAVAATTGYVVVMVATTDMRGSSPETSCSSDGRGLHRSYSATTHVVVFLSPGDVRLGRPLGQR